MTILRAVSFGEVRTAFLANNTLGKNAYEWTLGVLDLADRQFGAWLEVRLVLTEMLTIMLPRHMHENGQQIIPESGGTVSGTIQKLRTVPLSDPCNQKMAGYSSDCIVPIFLSATPVPHRDYEGLLGRNYHGITHLDGLHHLILWGQTQKPEIVAYLAVK